MSGIDYGSVDFDNTHGDEFAAFKTFNNSAFSPDRNEDGFVNQMPPQSDSGESDPQDFVLTKSQMETLQE